MKFIIRKIRYGCTRKCTSVYVCVCVCVSVYVHDKHSYSCSYLFSCLSGVRKLLNSFKIHCLGNLGKQHQLHGIPFLETKS